MLRWGTALTQYEAFAAPIRLTTLVEGHLTENHCRVMAGFWKDGVSKEMKSVKYLKQSHYETKPWKNEQGITTDIYLEPSGAGHDDFEFRISLAEIDKSSVFSSFPGIDRCITLIEGEGLQLEFGEDSVYLSVNESYRFDSELCPVGVPMKGAVRVMNVMVGRQSGEINDCRIVSALEEPHLTPGRVFFCVLAGVWDVKIEGDHRTLQMFESVIADNIGSIACHPRFKGVAIYVNISFV